MTLFLWLEFRPSLRREKDHCRASYLPMSERQIAGSVSEIDAVPPLNHLKNQDVFVKASRRPEWS
jgi:hypothetical protein